MITNCLTKMWTLLKLNRSFKRFDAMYTQIIEQTIKYTHMGSLGASSTHEDDNTNDNRNNDSNSYTYSNNHANGSLLWHWKKI